MTIDYSGNVGIGSTGPIQKLDVSGYLNFGGATASFVKTASKGILLDVGGGANDLEFNTATAGSGYGFKFYGTGNDGTLRLARRSNSTTWSDLMAFTDPGSVAIGTAIPQAQLQVYGAGQLTSALTDAGATTGTLNITGALNASNAGGALLFSSINNAGNNKAQAAIKSLLIDGTSSGIGDLAFSTRNATGDTALAERMRIRYNGNVGIGTNGPISMLQAAGTFTAGAGPNAYSVGTAQILAGSSPVSSRLTFGTDNSGWQFRIGKNVSGTVTDLVTIQDNGNVGIGTAPSAAAKLHINVGTNQNLWLRTGSSTPEITFINGAGSAHVTGRINAGPLIINTESGGNVGIGTTGPQAKLDTVGAIRAEGNIYVDRSGGALTSYMNISQRAAGSAGVFGNALGNGQTEIISVGTAGIILGSYDANPIAFGTNNAERMRITSGGNVGIGTAVPAKKLDVTTVHTINIDDEIRLGSYYSGNFYGLGLNYRLDGAGTPSQHIVSYYGGTRTTNLSLTSTGLGIGTTMPNNPLQVVSNSAGLSTAWASNTNASGVSVMGYNGSTGTYGQLGVGSYAGIFMNGNVGIGTTTPSYRLDVLGAAGTYAGRFVSSDGTASYLIGGNGFANSMQASTTANGTYTIYSSASGAANAIGVYGNASNSASYGVLGLNGASNYFCYLGGGSYSITCSGPTSGISDKRLKKDIRPLEANEGLSAIMQIEPVHYRWKDERMNTAHPGGEIGFIAQNVEAVLPLLVSESAQLKDAPIKLEGGMQKALQYDRLAAPIIKAVQELKHMIDAVIGDVKKLAARVDKIFTRLAAHDSRLKKLEDENKAMRDALCKLDGSPTFCHPAVSGKTSLMQKDWRARPFFSSDANPSFC
jgi:hypothetical protein